MSFSLSPATTQLGFDFSSVGRWTPAAAPVATIATPAPAAPEAPADEALTGWVYARVRLPELMRKHGLTDKGWGYKFDKARSRAGACNYTKRLIHMSAGYVAKASNAEIDDTILHEIAHALVGPQHGHGPVWKAKAREIGCSAERCHTVRFTEPRWLFSCSKGCCKGKIDRRRRRAVGRRCGTVVTYTRNPDAS